MFLGKKILLIEASSIGDLSKVKELLNNGASVYARDEKGNTALHVAAMKGHLNIVKELLSKGALIHACNSDGLTPFELVNKGSALEKFLLNYRDNSGKTLLHYSTSDNNPKLIDLLLKKGADVNVQDKKGNTPLHVAAMKGHLNIVKELLNSGAKIYTRNKNGLTPFELVNEGSALEKFLLNYRDNSGSTLLHCAAFDNNPQLIDFLLKKGADVNVQDKEGNTPLHVAARYGHLNAVNKLLIVRFDMFRSGRIAKVNIDAKNNNNSTSLHIAARYGHLYVVKKFLNEGANIYFGNNVGNTPLHVAVRHGYLDVVTELLNSGAKINAKNKKGNTPLHVAVRHGHLNIVGELLDKWAKTNAKNSVGDTPLHVAVKHGHLNIVGELLDKGAKTNAKNSVGDTPLHVAVKHGHLNIVEKLLDKWAKINDKNSVGDTPLHVAVKHGHLNIVGELLDKGAKINDKNSVGDTPLHVAVKHGHLNIVEKLLDKGANIYVKNHNNLTPLELANNEGKSELVDFLNRKSGHGYTLTHYTVENNKTNLTDSLLQLWKENETDTKGSYDYIFLELANGADYVKGEVTSGAKNPFSLVNSLLSWVKNSISGLLSSRAALPETSASYFNTAKNPSNQYTSQFSSEVCVSNNVGLGFFLLQSFLDKKCPLPKFCSVTREEALADTLSIVEEFEKIFEKTAKQSGVSVKGFDFFKVYSDIAGHVRNERYSKIPSTLYSAVEEAYPKNEKFLSILKGNIEKMCDEQQRVNSGYQVQIPNDIADNKLGSYLNNTTVDKQLQNAISS